MQARKKYALDKSKLATWNSGHRLISKGHGATFVIMQY